MLSTSFNSVSSFSSSLPGVWTNAIDKYILIIFYVPNVIYIKGTDMNKTLVPTRKRGREGGGRKRPKVSLTTLGNGKKVKNLSNSSQQYRATPPYLLQVKTIARGVDESKDAFRPGFSFSCFYKSQSSQG